MNPDATGHSPVKGREEILETLARHKPEFADRFKVRRLALFGSYARGDQAPGSDVDVLVEVDPAIGLDFVTLADRIEEVVGLPVHIVSTRALKPRAWRAIEGDLVDV